MKRSNRNVLLSALLLGGFAFSASGQAVVQNFWDFEGGYGDKVGSANGTAGPEVTATAGHNVGGTAMFAPGAVTGGGVFTPDGYVDLPAPQVHNSGANAFSISYWFKIDNDGTTNARGIFDFSGDGFDGPQSLYIGNTDELAFRVDGTGGGGPALYDNGGAGFEDDAWHFVAATYDPVTGIELHVDGYGVVASTGGFGDVNWDFDQYLGAFNVDVFNPTKINQGLDGALDDVAIYSGILSEAEITGLADGTLSPFQITGGISISSSGACPGNVTINAIGATPRGRIAFAYGLRDGTTPVLPCPSMFLDIRNAKLAGVARANASGEASVSGNVPGGACSRVRVQAVDLDACIKSNKLTGL